MLLEYVFHYIMKHSKKIWVLFINELYKNIENTGGKV